MEWMKAALAQTRPRIGDIGGNLAELRSLIDKAAELECGLLCLPEACVTGYSTANATEIAIGAGDPRLTEIEAHARTHGIALSYGFIEQAGGALFITHVVAGAHDGRLVYRKTHLGSREGEVFEAGGVLPVAHIDGTCLGIQLCWEANIPDITTTYRAQGAELVLMPYASGASGLRRREIWERILPARASDNGIYVLACNALPTSDDGATRGGGLAAFDPKGRELASCYESREQLIVCELSGKLPRNGNGSMNDISYFDRRRPELYRP